MEDLLASLTRPGPRRAVLLTTVLLVAGCRRSTSEEILRASGARPLTASEVRAAFAGRSIRGRNFEPQSFFVMAYGADGVVEAKIGNSFDEASSAMALPSRDVGKWRAREDGALCLRWSHWLPGRESCLRVYGAGRKFEAYRADGSLGMSFRLD